MLKNLKTKMKKIFASVISVFVMTSIALPTMTPHAATQTLLNTYGNLFKYSGAAVNSSQLNNSTTLGVIKTQYNSITMENEMKPDAVLGSSPTLISVSQAKSKGYYIPSNYTESTVPSLNFSTIDSVLRICYNNGL